MLRAAAKSVNSGRESNRRNSKNQTRKRAKLNDCTLARPGMYAIGWAGDEGPIIATTEQHCIFRNEDGVEILLRWEEVLIGHLKPDPKFTLK